MIIENIVTEDSTPMTTVHLCLIPDAGWKKQGKEC